MLLSLTVVSYTMLTYCLLTVNQGSTGSIIEEIKEACSGYLDKFILVYGEFDMVLILKAPSDAKMTELADGLKKLKDIKTIHTYTVQDKTYEHNVLPK